MKREHKVVSIRYDYDHAKMPAELDAIAVDGWQLVTIYLDRTHSTVAVFVREIND